MRKQILGHAFHLTFWMQLHMLRWSPLLFLRQSGWEGLSSRTAANLWRWRKADAPARDRLGIFFPYEHTQHNAAVGETKYLYSHNVEPLYPQVFANGCQQRKSLRWISDHLRAISPPVYEDSGRFVKELRIHKRNLSLSPMYEPEEAKKQRRLLPKHFDFFVATRHPHWVPEECDIVSSPAHRVLRSTFRLDKRIGHT